jgi:hypothetical protein
LLRASERNPVMERGAVLSPSSSSFSRASSVQKDASTLLSIGAYCRSGMAVMAQAEGAQENCAVVRRRATSKKRKDRRLTPC